MNKENNKTNLPKIISKRSLSRLIAIQALYQNHFFDSSQDLQDLKSKLLDEYLLNIDDKISSYQDKVDMKLLDDLIKGASENSVTIDDKIISSLDDKYKITDLDPVILQILRLSCYELQNSLDIPAKVVINEYVDIAASFFDKRKVMFCNAVIDRIALNLNRLKKDE